MLSMRLGKRDAAVLTYLAPYALTAAYGLAAWASKGFALPYPASAVEEVVGSGPLFVIGVITAAAATAMLLTADAKGRAGDAAVWAPLLLASFNLVSYLLFASAAAGLGPVAAFSMLSRSRYPALYYLSMLAISALAWLVVARARGVDLRRRFLGVARGLAPLAGLLAGAALYLAGQSLTAFAVTIAVSLAAGLAVSRGRKARQASGP